MGKKVWMFPGQGSQEVGMGKALHDKHKEVQDLFDKASHITKRDLRKIVFEGPKETLDKTSNTQVAILIVSLGILAVYLKNNHGRPGEERPDMIMGHSLGEVTAATVAGGMSEEDAIALTFERGLAMEEEGIKNPGGMAAILGVPDAEVESLALAHDLAVANYNIPDSQAVVSGKPGNIEAVIGIMGRRARKLAVTIAAHAPEMGGAVQRVEDRYHSLKTNEMLIIPLIANRTGGLVARLSEIELPHQLVRPVRWGQSVESAIDEGATEFVEIGHNTVLSDMVRRQLKGRLGIAVRNAEAELLNEE